MCAGCWPKQLNNVMYSTQEKANHTTGQVGNAHVDLGKLYYFLFYICFFLNDAYYYFSNYFVTIKNIF